MVSVFQKLWLFVSAVVSVHVRAFATVTAAPKLTYLEQADFIINTTYLLRSSGLSPTSAVFPAFTLLNSRTVTVNRQVLPSIES